MLDKEMTIANIKEALRTGTVTEEWLDMLRTDKRKGVQMLLERYDKKKRAERQLEKNYETLLTYEKEWRAQGFHNIAGVDEAGRGPLAGPVTACAVILPHDSFFPGLNDSKQLTKGKREYFAALIKERALAYEIVHVPAQTVDKINIYQAAKEAMIKAVTGLSLEADALFIDALTLPLPAKQLRLIQGDAKSASIAAASVLAKTARDSYMLELAERYPEYGFDRHMGYGTKEHLAALQEFGPTPEHRRSFSPVQSAVSRLNG
ncbi:ribonuclease HII [Bacillus piscicola]|uniref:ribonuclease HII n=1 Tax=Bacillus piscicola TaxID=1632684 RepID=UPI001F08C34D|nr:ribonuclease HII [Bacillus piscicola]